jgi:hypothetical protein
LSLRRPQDKYLSKPTNEEVVEDVRERLIAGINAAARDLGGDDEIAETRVALANY